MFGSLAALKYAHLLTGVISVNSYWNKWKAKADFETAKKGGLRVCLVHGSEAPHLGTVKEGVEALSAAGIPAKVVTYDGDKKLPENIKKLLEDAFRWVTGG